MQECSAVQTKFAVIIYYYVSSGTISSCTRLGCAVKALEQKFKVFPIVTLQERTTFLPFGCKVWNESKHDQTLQKKANEKIN